MAIRVTCTGCGAAYKLDESKIPATGGAIKCQSCGTRFAVMRPPPDAPAEVVESSATAKHAPLSRSLAPMEMENTPTVPNIPRPSIPLPAETTPVEKPPTNPMLLGDEATTPIALGGDATSPIALGGDATSPIALGGETTSPHIASAGVTTNPKIPLGGAATSPIALGGQAPNSKLAPAGATTSPKSPLGGAALKPIALGEETTKPSIALGGAAANPTAADGVITKPIALGGDATSPKIPLAGESIAAKATSAGVAPKPVALGGNVGAPSTAPIFAQQAPSSVKPPPGGDKTHPSITAPVFAQPPAGPTPAAARRNEPAIAIPLPSASDVLSSDMPIDITDDDDVMSVDDSAETLVGPAPTRDLPPLTPTAPEPLALDFAETSGPLDLPAPLDLPPEPKDRADEFDDLPVPAFGAASEPTDLPDFDGSATVIGQRPSPPEEPAQFAGIELDNAPSNIPTDLPRLATPDDMPRQLDDGVPEPLEASIPEPAPSLGGDHGADQMPGPLDLPEPMAPLEMLPSTAETGSLSESLEGTDEAPATKRGRSGRILLVAGVVVLMTAGAFVTSYLMTGQMPWALLNPPPAPPTQPAQPPIPPLPDLAALETKDLAAFRRALTVLEERKTARRARQQPEASGEDDAARAKLLWHGALLLGSKALGEQLEQDPRISAEQGDDTHPHIERAQAALAFLRGKPAEMDQKLDKLLARDKGDNDALLIRGYGKLAGNDTIGASKAFDDVLKINPKNVDALLGHADVARRSQDRDGAASYVEQAEAAAPDNARVKLARAELQLDDTDARAQGRKALEALGSAPDALGERDRARLHFALARVDAQAGLAQKARAALLVAASEDRTAPIMRALVWQQLYAEQLDKAAETLQAAAKAEVDAGEAFFLAKATLLFKQGSIDKLIEIQKLGGLKGSEKRMTLYVGGLVLEAQKKNPAALKAYAAAAKADKTFSWPVLAEVRVKAPKAKLKLVRLALLAKAANDAPSLAAYADALHDESQFKAAAERYEQALDKDPWLVDLARVSERYAVSLQKSGRQQDAARIVIANQTVDAKNVKAVLDAAAIARNAEAYEEGQRLIEQGLEEHPKDTQLRIAQAEFLVARGNRDKARNLLTQLLKDEDKNPLVHEAMARSYHPADPDLVKLHIKNAIQLSPNETRFHVLLGDSYFAKNKYDEAHDAYERAHELDGKNVDVLVQLSRVAELQGKKKEAIDRAREALKMDPSRRVLVLELGQRLEDMDQRGEALKLYQDALKREPSQSELLARIGRVYQGNGNRPLALKTYLAALKANPSDPTVHYRLGYLYKDANQTKPAIKAFEAYLRLAPKADDRKEIEAEIADLRK